MACVIAAGRPLRHRPRAPRSTFWLTQADAGRRSPRCTCVPSTAGASRLRHAAAWSSPTRWATC
ncbi:MAG: hypothetical protein MZW92_79065 [Comamonadaceae bacterium]|nr:hypothetical protein [Comamonadaceae bacterium]